MPSLIEYVRMPDDQLVRQDPAAINLACMEGLPGVLQPDVRGCLKRLDDIARRVKAETLRLRCVFERAPRRFENFFGRYCVSVMTTIAQRDFGVRYALDLNELSDEEFFRNADNYFVHAALRGRGTCMSLPVVYLALGWRLGYPLKLVSCARHLFVRWHEPKQTFNIECTSHGFVSHPDEYYRKWPEPLTLDQIKNYCALQSLTPCQMLAKFLGGRGTYLSENAYFKQAVESFAVACGKHPESWGYRDGLIHTMKRWENSLRQRLVPGFPNMRITLPQRWFAHLPRMVEMQIAHLIMKEFLLNHSECRARWWEPMRYVSCSPPKDVPAQVIIEFPVTGQAMPKLTFLSSGPVTARE